MRGDCWRRCRLLKNKRRQRGRKKRNGQNKRRSPFPSAWPHTTNRRNPHRRKRRWRSWGFAEKKPVDPWRFPPFCSKSAKRHTTPFSKGPYAFCAYKIHRFSVVVPFIRTTGASAPRPALAVFSIITWPPPAGNPFFLPLLRKNARRPCPVILFSRCGRSHRCGRPVPLSTDGRRSLHTHKIGRTPRYTSARRWHCRSLSPG